MMDSILPQVSIVALEPGVDRGFRFHCSLTIGRRYPVNSNG